MKKKRKKEGMKERIKGIKGDEKRAKRHTNSGGNERKEKKLIKGMREEVMKEEAEQHICFSLSI